MFSFDLGLAEQTKLKHRIEYFGWWVIILGMVADHPGDVDCPFMAVVTWS